MTDRHLCLDCRGQELAPARTGENHVSYRFGDQFKYRVYFEGSDVTDWVSEAVAGRDSEGWILKLCALGPNRSMHPCQRCGVGMCMWRLYGNTRIERTKVPA